MTPCRRHSIHAQGTSSIGKKRQKTGNHSERQSPTEARPVRAEISRARGVSPGSKGKEVVTPVPKAHTVSSKVSDREVR
jgi:hypothetical protein